MALSASKSTRPRSMIEIGSCQPPLHQSQRVLLAETAL